MYEEKNNMDSRMLTTVCVRPSESFTWNFNPKVTYTVKGNCNGAWQMKCCGKKIKFPVLLRFLQQVTKGCNYYKLQ